MKHFLGDDKGSIADLEMASKTKYADAGLNERVKDYVERINSDKKPRMTEKEDGGH